MMCLRGNRIWLPFLSLSKTLWTKIVGSRRGRGVASPLFFIFYDINTKDIREIYEGYTKDNAVFALGISIKHALW